MSSADLEVEPGQLERVSRTLDSAGSTLFDSAPALNQTPDAGASSGEVANALAALASAAAGLAQTIGALSTSVVEVSRDFTTTDTGVGDHFRQPTAGPGPTASPGPTPRPAPTPTPTTGPQP